MIDIIEKPNEVIGELVEPKRCTRCGDEKELTEFNRDAKNKTTGRRSQCKTCTAEVRALNTEKYAPAKKAWALNNIDKVRASRRKYNKANPVIAGEESEHRKIKNSEYKRAWQKRNPMKAAAHSAVFRAIANGKLIRPSHCSWCDNERVVEGHHWSYEKEYWLDVEWLCKACHTEIHWEEML